MDSSDFSIKATMPSDKALSLVVKTKLLEIYQKMINILIDKWSKETEKDEVARLYGEILKHIELMSESVK